MKRNIILGVLIFIAVSCVTVYDTINNRNFSKEYNPGLNQLHPNYFIYKSSASKNFLYFQFFPKEFAFIKAPNDTVSKARVSLFFRVTKTYGSIEILDSLTTNFTLKGLPQSQFTGYVPIQLPEFGTYVIEVFLTDQNLNNTVSNVLHIKNDILGGEASYMWITKSGLPVYHNYIEVGDSIRVINQYIDNGSVLVQFSPSDTLIPLPPDIQKENTNDLSFNPDTIHRYNRLDTTIFGFSKTGQYVFCNPDLTSFKTLGVYHKSFPYVNTAAELLEPLGYLTSVREMKKLLAMNNPKAAVDSFWLNTTGDLEQARELIRVYYNRVQLANYFFTDINEGWKTDRGMIYVIFGFPTVVTFDNDGETWVYGKDAESDLSFFFYRENHPVLGTYYQLNRSDNYGRVWFNATETWRTGRVFSINR